MLIQPRPGTDGALALAVAHVLVRARLGGRGRSWRGTCWASRRSGTTSARARPRGPRACAACPRRQIHQLAEWLGGIGPATICAGFGMQRFTNSGQAMRAMIALLALTGNIGTPGAGWVFANLTTQVFGAHKDPLDFYPPAVPDGIVRVSISTAMLGPQMLETRDPPLAMAWVERGNPIPQNPETGTVLRAFRALEFRVVVDEFLTDTAREADIVLPAKTLFEQTDVIGAYWHDYLQCGRR